MFTKIELTKFQGFDEPSKFQTKPLTLIFGPNASGKSSIIRSLLLLKQSINTDGNLFSNSVSGFSYDGPDISLASFANVVHKHEETAELEIEASIDDFASTVIRSGVVSPLIVGASVKYRIGIKAPLNSLELSFDLVGLEDKIILNFDYADRKLSLVNWSGLDQLDGLKADGSRTGTNLEGDPENDGDGVVGYLDWPVSEKETTQHSRQKNTWDEVASGLTFRLRNNFPTLRGTPRRSTFESIKIRQLDDLITSVQIALSKHLKDIRHIGPLRTISERLSYEAGLVEDDVDGSDENTRGSTPDQVVSDWLYKLTDRRYKFQPVEFYAEPVKFLGSLKSQILVDTISNTPVTFADVGVGLSQVLPILHSMQISKKRSNPTTLLIEQPELHLHPAMQANLADLFVDAVSNNSKMQIIAETHSESMLLRIQKRLRDGKISPELVQILYVDKGINGNQVSELKLNSEDEFSISMPVSFSQLRLRDLL